MATATHVLPFKRKREGRTNYKRRLALLKSGMPRVVIRRSNRHLLLQLVRYEPDGDAVLVSVSSKTLAKRGWKHSTKSLPAAYLTGVLFGQAATAKAPEAIVDLGLQRFAPGNRYTAAIKGAIDGGLKLPASGDVFPDGARLAGRHISDAVATDAAALASKLGVVFPAAAKKEKPAEKPKAPKEPKPVKEAPKAAGPEAPAGQAEAAAEKPAEKEPEAPVEAAPEKSED